MRLKFIQSFFVLAVFVYNCYRNLYKINFIKKIKSIFIKKSYFVRSFIIVIEVYMRLKFIQSFFVLAVFVYNCYRNIQD